MTETSMLYSILSAIDGLQDELIALQRTLVSLPAMGPVNGGDGEKDKADFILSCLRQMSVPVIEQFNAPDNRVSCGYRPNIMARIPGRDKEKTLWIISHIDIVPQGDPELWNTDPFTLNIEGDILIGRGVEDNHSGIIPSLLLAKAILQTNADLPFNLGLLFVADEETGSAYGLDYILKKHSHIFAANDLFLVPDIGCARSDKIEVAEKSMFWLKVTTTGRQCHASSPELGMNAMVAGSALVLILNKELPQLFPATDPLFSPACSTFSPTKREANVPNINTVPGKDTFYLDCRVLPQYKLEDVLAAVKQLALSVEEEYGVQTTQEMQMVEPAPQASSTESEIFIRLARAIKEEYHVEAKPYGVGGGTVAASLRRAGYQAMVWHTCIGNAHEPNEKARISFQMGDAKVMARMLF